MAVASKGRRKFVVDGCRYLWWVAEDEQYGMALTVASEDRRLLVRYHLQQPPGCRHVTVLGPRFRDIAGCGGSWRRFRCPEFGAGASVTPADLAALIRWSSERDGAVLEVDYAGNPV